MPMCWYRAWRCLFLVASLIALPAAHAADEPKPDAAPEKIEKTIAVGSDAGSDARIASRLTQLFATLDGLQGVRVAVSAGVVDLSGEVPNKATHDLAMRLAQRVEGVVEVRDRVTESRDLGQRLVLMQERVVAQLMNFVGYLPLLVVALVVVAVFWWIAARVAQGDWLMRHVSRNPFLRDLAAQASRVLIVGVGLLLALEILDASTLLGSVLGAAGVMGLAIGFALRDTVENYIASLLLSLRQPFDRDDLVVIEGCEGRVLRLTPRATILLTLDGNHTRIPNAKVYKAVIVNYTRNPRRRFQFDVGVDNAQNLAAAQQLAADTLAGMDGVLDEPPPSCTVDALGDSNVVLRVFGWVDQERAEFAKVRSEAIRLVKAAFDRAGIVMPEPSYTVGVRSLDEVARAMPPLPERPAAPRERPAARTTAAADEPQRAIDIAPRDELDRHIAAERETGEQDLLDAKAPKE